MVQSEKTCFQNARKDLFTNKWRVESKIMIRNIIILVLLSVIVFDISGAEFLDYISLGLDKMQDFVYNVKSEVN